MRHLRSRCSSQSRAIPSAVERLERRCLLDAIPIGNEFLVNSTTTQDQFAASIAMDNNGNFVVVWAADSLVSGHAPDTDIWGQRYTAAGVPTGGQFQISQFTTGYQSNPSVAMDADGDFVVCWESGPADTSIQTGQDGSGFGIYARRYNSAGAAQGNEFLINGTTTGDQLRPSVAVDANGNFVVAWQSAAQDGNGFGVYARRFSSAGAALANEFKANTFTTGNQLDPSVARDQDGDFVVTWTSGNLSTGQDGSFYGVYAQRYNSSGAAQGGEFRVNTYTTDYQTASRVAMDTSGNFVVSWNSFAQDGSSYGIYAQRYNAAGAAQGGEFLVNTFTLNSQSGSAIDLDSSGNFTIVWSSEGQDGSGRGVYGKFYNSSGVVQGSEFRVNVNVAGNQTRPAVAMNASGFVVAYQDGSQTSGVDGLDGSGYGVYARRYSTATDTTPPTVTSSFFNFAFGHSVSLTFSESVAPSFTIGDVQLQNLTTATSVPTGQMQLSYSGTNPAILTFPGVTSNTGIPTILPDGNYRLTLLASQITDSAGNQLDGNGNGVGGDNYVFDFFVWAGDANHDRTVNSDDFNTLAGSFGQGGKNFTQGDFSYNTIVNSDDFNILAGKFGQTLPFPPPPGPEAAAAAITPPVTPLRRPMLTRFSTRRIDAERPPLPDSL